MPQIQCRINAREGVEADIRIVLDVGQLWAQAPLRRKFPIGADGGVIYSLGAIRQEDIACRFVIASLRAGTGEDRHPLVGCGLVIHARSANIRVPVGTSSDGEITTAVNIDREKAVAGPKDMQPPQTEQILVKVISPIKELQVAIRVEARVQSDLILVSQLVAPISVVAVVLAIGRVVEEETSAICAEAQEMPALTRAESDISIG